MPNYRSLTKELQDRRLVRTVAAFGLLLFVFIGFIVIVHSARQNNCAVPFPHNFSVYDWDNKAVRLHDERKCDGVLQNQLSAASFQNFDGLRRNRYISNLPNIEGWMAIEHEEVVKVLSDLQFSLGIFGSVGEIGVHHGKFWLALAGHARTDEKVVAVDVFDQQSKNIDGSGKGDLSIFYNNVREHLGEAFAPVIVPADSSSLTASTFIRLNVSSFRFFSIDGGHTLALTLSDLNLVSCIHARGAVVVVDDFVNPEWMGVLNAVIIFTHSQNALAPFLWLKNKIYFTTQDYHQTYLSHIKNRIPGLLCYSSSSGHRSRSAFGKYNICRGD
jgi:hypothetical protein